MFLKDCGSECRWFESHLPPASKEEFQAMKFLFFVAYQRISE